MQEWEPNKNLFTNSCKNTEIKGSMFFFQIDDWLITGQTDVLVCYVKHLKYKYLVLIFSVSVSNNNDCGVKCHTCYSQHLLS